MKKVTRLLSLMLAVILTATAFHGTDASVGSVKAQGESELNPIMLSYNKGLQTLKTNVRQEYWYAFDIPQDGDLKVTVVADELDVIHFRAGNESTLDYCKMVRTNSPLIEHFTTTPGRYYLHIKNNTSSFKVNIEYTSYGFKDAFQDSYENPVTYTPGTEVVGAVSYLDEEDWYKFQVPKNGKYKIGYRSEAGYFNLYIYDNDMNEYWSLNSAMGKNELQTTTKNFDAGTYYVKVKRWGWAKYRFSISNDGITPTKVKKVKSNKKGQIEVKFKGVDNVDGYQIRVCRNKKFTGKVKTKSIETGSYNKGKTLSATVKKLKRHKNYYVQVRTFEKIGSEKYYSDWSKAKKVKVK